MSEDLIMRTWLKYLLYILIICMVSFSRQYFTTLRGTTYIALFNIGVMILNVMVGVLLGAEVLDSEFKKEGSWKVNTPKLVLVGLPSLLIGFSSLILFGEFAFIGNLPQAIFANSGVFQLIFGYAISTSFYKTGKYESIV